MVVVLGAGIKEELQRAFVLHRFDQGLGGIRLGLVLFSIMFGVLHFDQGWDVAIAIGLLGLFWGVLYIKRRSAVMSMVNHAGFNAAQVAQDMLARALGCDGGALRGDRALFRRHAISDRARQRRCRRWRRVTRWRSAATT